MRNKKSNKNIKSNVDAKQGPKPNERKITRANALVLRIEALKKKAGKGAHVKTGSQNPQNQSKKTKIVKYNEQPTTNYKGNTSPKPKVNNGSKMVNKPTQHPHQKVNNHNAKKQVKNITKALVNNKPKQTKPQPKGDTVGVYLTGIKDDTGFLKGFRTICLKTQPQFVAFGMRSLIEQKSNAFRIVNEIDDEKNKRMELIRALTKVVSLNKTLKKEVESIKMEIATTAIVKRLNNIMHEQNSEISIAKLRDMLILTKRIVKVLEL